MVYVLMADGFEETELTAPVDMLRRAGVETLLTGVTGPMPVSSHRLSMKADILINDADPGLAEALFLPGGSLGVENLYASQTVREFVLRVAEKGLPIAAICAGPMIPGRMGLLKNRTFTCFPGCEKGIDGVYTGSAVEWDGTFLTGKGAGVSLAFGAAFVAVLKGRETAEKICQTMQMDPAVYTQVLSSWN